MQFEILKNPGIDFYSGFRKTSQGGGANLIPKKVGPPVSSNPGSATAPYNKYISVTLRMCDMLNCFWNVLLSSVDIQYIHIGSLPDATF